MRIHQETIKWLRMIFDRLIDNSETEKEYSLYCDLYDIIEYALANNIGELEKIYKTMKKTP